MTAATKLNSTNSNSEQVDPDQIFESLNRLLRVNEQLIKERKNLQAPHLIIDMVNGDLPVEENLPTIKADLKVLEKVVKLLLEHRNALSAAQGARTELDSIIGTFTSSSKPSAIATLTPTDEDEKPAKGK
jgi:hypothetical protein